MNSFAIILYLRDQGNQSRQETNHILPEEFSTMHGVETMIRRGTLVNAETSRNAHINMLF